MELVFTENHVFGVKNTITELQDMKLQPQSLIDLSLFCDLGDSGDLDHSRRAVWRHLMIFFGGLFFCF